MARYYLRNKKIVYEGLFKLCNYNSNNPIIKNYTYSTNNTIKNNSTYSTNNTINNNYTYSTLISSLSKQILIHLPTY